MNPVKVIMIACSIIAGKGLAESLNAQDSIKAGIPIYVSFDFGGGYSNNGYYEGAILRAYKMKNFLNVGYRVFHYVPDNFPEDYYSEFFGFKSSNAINQSGLILIGIGRFLHDAHRRSRLLFQANLAFGKYTKAVNFQKLEKDTGNFYSWFSFPAIFGETNYKYEKRSGFNSGLNLLVKTELCSRRLSIGINFESIISLQTTSFCAGLSIGFGKLRRKN